MEDTEILGRIRDLVDEEHGLRQRAENRDLSTDEEQERLRNLEESLDQCWDLLRQRRARRDARENPDAAAVRPTGEVEGYLQ
jgi:Rad3-related DNA helicase